MYEIFYLNGETMKTNTVLVYAESVAEAKDIFENYFKNVDKKIKKIIHDGKEVK